MNTATQLSAARTELELFQRNYGHIVSEYLKGGGKRMVALDGRLSDAAQLERVIKSYFDKVETVSKLTRIMNQEYLNTVNIEERRPLYVPRKMHAA